MRLSTADTRERQEGTIKIILLANTDWYLYNYRLALAKALRERGDAVLLVSPKGRYSALLQREGYEWRAFDLSRRGINPLAEARAIRQLVRLYQAEKPDMVQHFTIKCVLYGSLAARIAGVEKVVNSITGLGYVFSRKNLFTLLARPLVKWFYGYVLKGTRVIFQNTANQKTFLDWKLVRPGQSVVIAGSGVDVQHYQPAKKKGDEKQVVLPARMLWDKGVREFVEAARLLKKNGMQARFALTGDTDAGNPAAIDVEQLRAWQTEKWVEWWGWQDEMVFIYQKADIVCLPSYHEGLAKTLIEGAACGCALVATDIPGCREVVQDGVNGLLVPPHDSQALAEALEKLLKDDTLRTRMGQASRRLAEERFSVEMVNRATLKVYDDWDGMWVEERKRRY